VWYQTPLRISLVFSSLRKQRHKLTSHRTYELCVLHNAPRNRTYRAVDWRASLYMERVSGRWDTCGVVLEGKTTNNSWISVRLYRYNVQGSRSGRGSIMQQDTGWVQHADSWLSTADTDCRCRTDTPCPLPRYCHCIFLKGLVKVKQSCYTPWRRLGGEEV
jgi:hypothetical protein